MSLEKKIPVEENWEQFDAEALFPPPRLHTNHLTKVDQKEMTKIDSPDDGQGEVSGSSNPEELGDTYSDALVDESHVDEMFEMEGLEGGVPDDREINSDKEIDERTQEPDSDTSDSPADESKESEPTEPEAKAKDKEGADKPIQKESEGVDEVAEASSKVSEDVHGGDEATKDIEDSPNAADDGQNSENKGAESGQGGEDGEGDEGDGQAPDDADQSDQGSGEGEADGQGKGGESKGQTGNGKSESDGADSDNDAESDATKDLANENWETQADHSATALQLSNDLEEFEAKERDEHGHRTSLPSYDFDREDSPIGLEVAFQKGRELIKKLADEEDLTTRISGNQRWDAKALVRNMVTYRHARIPVSRYERPREADIAILLDISGSCEEQAEMFMAIAAGAIGNGVEIYVGYNGSCRASAMQVPKRLPRNYKQAKAWVKSEVDRVSGWENQEAVGEWSFEEFVEEIKPKTLIIFGDWDGIDQYQDVVHESKFRSTKFFWFCNEGHSQDIGKYPEKWNKKNYFPGVYSPQELVKSLRKIR